MNDSLVIELSPPAWLPAFLEGRDRSLEQIQQRMQLAIELAAENVRRGSGGPFGALVVEAQSGRLLGAGVNRVTRLGLSLAHAEIMALSMAQRRVGSWNLAAACATQLLTSCEPCAMCYGAVPWSGVSSLVWGADRADAEAAGFDEGDKPADWAAALERRGIAVQGGVLRAEAAAVLAAYHHMDGEIYHPGQENPKA